MRTKNTSMSKRIVKEISTYLIFNQKFDVACDFSLNETNITSPISSDVFMFLNVSPQTIAIVFADAERG